ncbi:N-terminal acetyltransferase B complex auxiliary subunit NAA25 isoform X2 [Malania oleifera]|uniref:N-terminal acetyltransferase B complex auxiliary subunit NAA25 isoform X2 n=1 Tax=Malania oleifera TaxID=397392 RepID=UPI0025AE583C|nr:N-terminal acetyltransferase B complex auxiliary subunit NAA25 isoform X2 [Malania oleifera]
MASKFGMAGGIPERRVRPIWDAIDSRQFKTALKLSQSLISKYPNSPYALSLKALILERMGKLDEALSTCLSAKDQLYTKDSILVDDLTLSTLQIVFQRLDRLDLATSCYEHACGKFPNNLELMMGLFNCYVREYSFVKQQQTAIKMYKIVGEERFLLWAVCSIQLQVFCGNGGEKLLLLAEGLLKKHIASHSLHEPEALIVYISVLEQQAKYGDAFEVLSGKLGSLLMIEVDKLRIQGRLLARAGDYAAAANIFQKILELCPDDWECFLHYLSCLLEDDSSLCNGATSDPVDPAKFAGCKFSHLTDEVFSSRLSNASTFVQKLQTEVSSEVVRCPYLAILEIERRKHLYGKGDDDKLIEALMQYFFRFGHLACFASDVEVFLQVLTLDKRTELLEKLKGSCDSLSMVPIKMLGKSITLFKIQELIGNTFKLPVDELVGSAEKMVEMYCKNLPLSKELDPQESMHGEELLSMACNLLIQLFWRTRDLGYILEAIMILECGLTIRRYVSQYKILLLHLYSHLGAFSLAYERYKSLDVKNILLETVSHNIVPQMLISPLWTDLNYILKDYLKFMDDYFRESADLTFLAYRHRNYSKVIEFVQFKERLQRSNQYLMVRVEAPILQLKQNAENIEEEESVLENLKCGVHFLELSNEIWSKSLTFNEDLQSRPWWTPTSDRNYLLEPFENVSYCPREELQLTKERETNVRKVIERRSLLPRLIYLSIQCASTSLKENVEANGSASDPKIFLELKILLERYAKYFGLPFSDAVDLVVGVSTGSKSSEVLNRNMVDWLNFAIFLNAWNLGSHELGSTDQDEHKPGIWHIVDSLLCKCILEKVRSMGLLSYSAGVDLPILLQLISESLAWHSLLIQSCARSATPSGKKKKKSGPADQLTSPISRAIRVSIQSLCDIVEEVSKWLREKINQSEDENLETILSALHRNGPTDERPGQVLRTLETSISCMSDSELGDWTVQALKLWSPIDVARKILSGQREVLSEFLQICELKLKSLQALRQHIWQIQA